MKKDKGTYLKRENIHQKHIEFISLKMKRNILPNIHVHYQIIIDKRFDSVSDLLHLKMLSADSEKS